MITIKAYDEFCATLPATGKVIQWGGSHVWKVGEKLFAVAVKKDDDRVFVTFKCSPESYEILKEQPGLRPAPYLASRGMKWIQMTSLETLDAEDLKLYLKESHRLAALNLTVKRRRELGLE